MYPPPPPPEALVDDSKPLSYCLTYRRLMPCVMFTDWEKTKKCPRAPCMLTEDYATRFKALRHAYPLSGTLFTYFAPSRAHTCPY